MVYDCFTFFNELDVLEIRLNVLKDVVDKFVLVEARKTHSGLDKPLYFDLNKSRFAAFHDRIVHVVVDDFILSPTIKEERDRVWARENIQRNAIARGLTGASDADTIIISDVDEIPNPKTLKLAIGRMGITKLFLGYYNYYVNYRNYTRYEWDLQVQVLDFKTFLDKRTYEGFSYRSAVIKGANPIPSATIIRFLPGDVSLRSRPLGWHFSFLGGVEAVRYKLLSYADPTDIDLNLSKEAVEERIRRRIKEGRDMMGKGDLFCAEIMDESYPRYLRENESKYRHLIIRDGIVRRHDLKKKWLRLLWRVRVWCGRHLSGSVRSAVWLFYIKFLTPR